MNENQDEKTESEKAFENDIEEYGMRIQKQILIDMLNLLSKLEDDMCSELDMLNEKHNVNVCKSVGHASFMISIFDNIIRMIDRYREAAKISLVNLLENVESKNRICILKEFSLKEDKVH